MMPRFGRVLLLTLCLLTPRIGAGAETPPVLRPVTVTGTIENPAGAPSVLSGELLRRLPGGNGNMAELLRVLPDVQLDENYRSSLTGGEILPPSLSISGGKPSQNHFLLGGIPTDSLLDPEADDRLPETDVRGHAQALFPYAGLLEKVTVYDSNVPAEFGSFTGGVISARLRDPAPDFGGRLLYRTTRDGWTRFHVSEEDRVDFENSRSFLKQPRFEKHQSEISLDIPLRPGLGLTTAYQGTFSRIPLRHFQGSRDQVRRLENYLFRAAGIPGDDTLAEATFIYTPYEAELFMPGAIRSDYTVEAGGALLSGEVRHFLPAGELRLQLGAGFSDNTREAPPHWRSWALTPSRAWGSEAGLPFSAEGGYGRIEKRQEDLSGEISLALEPLSTGGVRHRLKGGIQTIWTRGVFDRRDTSFIYKGVRVTPDVVCGDALFDCVDGEQYFNRRVVYPEARVEAQITRSALYLEDQLTFGRLSVRPGGRLSYDDFTRNLDFAPRLAAAYDLFGDGRTVLTAGANRYYGHPLLTYKLREARKPHEEQFRPIVENVPGEWGTDPFVGANVTRFSRLKTPFSEEVAAGIDQLLGETRLSLKYVQRGGHDEFAREYGPRQPDGLRYYTLGNDGHSRHRSYRATLERAWRRHLLSFSATWQETTVSNEGYDITIEDDLEDRVWFDGRIVSRADLPRQNYNRPVILNLTWTAELPGGVRFANIAQYRTGYRKVEDTFRKQEIPGGQRTTDPLTGEEMLTFLDVLEERKYGGDLVLDWKIEWEKTLWAGQSLLVNLEVYNVFDARVPAGPDPGRYQIGRQFWAGAQYRF